VVFFPRFGFNAAANINPVDAQFDCFGRIIRIYTAGQKNAFAEIASVK
jgi:hypothetical protein